MRQVFLDTETTGLSAELGDRVIEIGCVEMVDRRLSGRTLHHYLNPQRSSHPDALRIHGLGDEFLSDKPLFAAVVDGLLAFIDGAEVVIHNASFDVGFLDHELARLQRPALNTHAGKITDSLLMAREMFPGKSNSLDALCKRLEVDNRSRSLHGALLDAGLLAEVYLAMTRGQKSLVVDAEPAAVEVQRAEQIDLRQFALPVVVPSADEDALHARCIASIDAAASAGALWHRAVAN
jgi:DNA polymerase III subunit epsilon